MKNIGIVSCIYQNNYGSLLQAYATKEYLESLGMNCEFVDYKKLNDVKMRKNIFFISQIFRWSYLKIKLPMLIQKAYIKLVKNNYSKSIYDRYRKFTLFRNEHFKTSPEFTNLRELTKYSYDNYNALVVGSDQLWLPGNVVAGFYSLSFIDRKVGIRKISFATSIGQGFIPNDLKEKYKKYLLDFDYISVREKKGAEILSEVLDKQIDVISDPVFLLSKEKWLKTIGNNKKKEKKYVLCYFLGNARKRLIRIKDYCVENNFDMKVISNEERRCSEERIADTLISCASPFEFLQLINDAEVICTDSFHLTTFSIIICKKFIPFMKYSINDKYSTNGRIIELLSEFGLEFDYQKSEESTIAELVFDSVLNKDIVINERINKAEAYLRKALCWNDKNNR